MLSGIVNYKEIALSKKRSIKPNLFLEAGKRTFRQLKKKKSIKGTLGDIISNTYRPGIFKRYFINNIEHGMYYITAQTMNTQDAVSFAKILSRKMTQNIEPMVLRHQEILVSCAGTVGNVRFIDKTIAGNIGSQDIIRVVPNDENYGFVYAYLATPTIYSYLQSQIYGSVVSRIEPHVINNIPLVDFPDSLKNEVELLIREANELKEKAISRLANGRKLLKAYCNLDDLREEEYDVFGPTEPNRKVSIFVVNKKDINSVTINAFNHSKRIKILKEKISSVVNTKKLIDCLDSNGFFSTGSFPRDEVNFPNGIQLINQQDIFDSIIKGKCISKRGVKLDKLVEEGEIIIAGVGTLGETETFCRCIYANGSLKGKLVSGEFIRMKAQVVPSGYLYLWLSTDYGFRLIRNTQAGTKLCRPLQKLLSEIPVPILNSKKIEELNALAITAQEWLYQSTQKELKAINILEKYISDVIN